MKCHNLYFSCFDERLRSSCKKSWLFKIASLGYCKSHLPLSLPTPHTRMLTIGWEWRRVCPNGSIRFSISFSSTRSISLPWRLQCHTISIAHSNSMQHTHTHNGHILDTHLSPDAGCVVQVVFVVWELPDAVINSNAALARCHLFLWYLHPAQRSHSKTLRTTHSRKRDQKLGTLHGTTNKKTRQVFSF